MQSSPISATAFDPLSPLTGIVERRLADLLLFGITAIALVLLILTSSAFRIVDWLYVLQHSLVLGFALTRSEPVAADRSVRCSIAVAGAYLYPYAQILCLCSLPNYSPWPDAGIVLTTGAAVFSLICLLTLRTRFGVRPALRGLVTGGPYQLVRHPLYLSYLIADLGYNLQLCNLATFAVALVGWTCMFYRIAVEERVMSNDPEWAFYVADVKHRLLPCLW